MIRILSLLITLSGVCLASPTLYGPTGLIEMPSAESVAYKQVNLAVDYSIANNNKNNQTPSEPEFYYKFNLGSFENWELGVLGGSFLDEGVFVNMKYFLMSNQEENPLSIAAGIERLGSKSNLSTYLVTSKRFSGGLHGHFGFKAFFQSSLFASAMIGFEYFSDEKVSFLADITGEKSQKYVLNAGTKIFIDNDIALRLYLIDITKSRESQETLYTFGLSLSKYI
ncbi:MAG: hypothetical protein VW397_08940 [Candidatus Margulisiibacteriota bacterium]